MTTFNREERPIAAASHDPPKALWMWIGLEALSFVVAPFLRPGPPVFVTNWALFGAFTALLAFGLWRRSRLAWVIALVLSVWGIFAGLLVFPAFFSGSEDIEWFVWGLGFSTGTLLALVSPSMRAWIKEATPKPGVEPT